MKPSRLRRGQFVEIEFSVRVLPKLEPEPTGANKYFVNHLHSVTLISQVGSLVSPSQQRERMRPCIELTQSVQILHEQTVDTKPINTTPIHLNKKRKFEYNEDDNTVQGQSTQRHKRTHNSNSSDEEGGNAYEKSIEQAKRPVAYENMVIDEQINPANKSSNVQKPNGNVPVNELTATFQIMPTQ